MTPRKPSASKRQSTQRKARKQHKTPARRTSAADLLALLTLGLAITLAACNTTTPSNPDGGGPGTLTVRFLDVGQGDAVLVQSPEGKTLLVDGGRSTTRMAELMNQYDISKIDLMVASHADADHIAGLIEAAKADPTYFINNGIAGTTQTWERLVTALQGAGTTFQKANNQVFNLGSARVRVIAPPAGMGDDQNNNSVGIRVDFGNFHALMTGDSETPETTAWLGENRPEIEGPIQAYKSIHHGAANGDHKAWLSAVRPENVVISVGPNNYGHPTQAALDLYKTTGAKVYRTDERGTITFTAKSDGTYIIGTER